MLAGDRQQRLADALRPQCPSRARKALAGREVLRAPDRAGQAHERLPGAGGSRPFQLIADDLALRHAGLGRHALEPGSELLAETHADCLTHMAKVYYSDGTEAASASSREDCSRRVCFEDADRINV